VTEDHEQLIADLAEYALGSLEGPDRLRVETHLASCGTCASRLEEYRVVLGALPLGLEPVAPPARALASICAAARLQQPDAPARPRILATWRWATWPLVAGLVVGVLLWNVWLQREVSLRPPGPEVEALARRPGRLVILAGADAPEASARLLVAVDGHHGHLAIAGLRPLPPGRTYQLWFLPASALPVTGGTFAVDAGGRAWATITVPISLDEARVIAITEEPSSGSKAPTGTYLLEAYAWR
jgi:anti-sigma-K factor RskA